MPDILRKSVTSAVIKSDDAQGVVEAVVGTTGGDPDRQGDVVLPGAWRKAVASVAQKAPKVVWHHENGITSDKFTLAGKVTGLRELLPGDPSLPESIQSAGRGALVAKMQFNLSTQVGREVYSNVAGGFTDEWSVGFLPEDAAYNKDRGYNEIKSAYPLLEVSPVLMGASVGTATLSAKAAETPTSQSTDDPAAADTANGTPATRAEEDVETETNTRSNTVANEPTPDAGAEPVVKSEDLRSMIADAIKTALDNRTDPDTRPSLDGVAVTTAPQDKSADELKAKGYFTPVAQLASERVEGFNINWYPRGDIYNFSVARYSYAQSMAQNGLNQYAVNQIAPWEKQYIEAGQRDKMVNPITKANMGDMVSGQDGGFLAPEQWNQQLYDLLYPSSIVSQLPVTIQQVPTRIVHWPVLSNNVTVYYVGENAALTASSPQFRQITATMRKQAVLVYLSNELIRDSSPQADNVLRNHAAIEMAIDQDAALLAGDGTSGGPKGLLSMSGVTTSTGPAHLGYTDLVKGIFQVETLNGSTITRVGQAGCTGIVANPVLKKQIAALVDSNARPLWDFSLRNVNISGSPAGNGRMPNPGAPLAGFLNVPAWALSNNNNTTASASAPLPKTEGSQNIFFGDWRWIILAQRMDIEFMASNVAGNTFANDQTAIRLIRRYDVVCPHPEAFFVLQSVSS